MTEDMSKITFRADDDLVDELEAFDASKSEVLRDALRSYLERCAGERPVEEVVSERVDEALVDRLGEGAQAPTQDVHVRISVDGDGPVSADGGSTGESAPHRTADGAAADRWDSTASSTHSPSSETTVRATDAASKRVLTSLGESARPCGQCGTTVERDHVYCPNCGEKAARRVFCECGEEVHSDWAFCPSCGRRTPAADVLDSR